MTEVARLKLEIAKIKARNKRVEADKAWETSTTRKVVIAISTYIVMSLLLLVIHADRPLLSAIIPTMGYLLSTISFGFIKAWWIHNRLQQ